MKDETKVLPSLIELSTALEFFIKEYERLKTELHDVKKERDEARELHARICERVAELELMKAERNA
jgi:hypothetical protein